MVKILVLYLIFYINLIGFGIYYVENGAIETINFDVISNCSEEQDSNAVIRGMRVLRKQSFFCNIDTKNYIIWADCGSHFRSELFCGYLFKELKDDGCHGNIYNL